MIQIPPNIGYQSPTNKIRLADPNDLSYVHHLQRLHSKNIGYLNRRIISDAIDQGNTWLIDYNTDNAGYLIVYPRRSGILRVVQIAVEPALLRTTLGTKLMQTLRTCAQRHGATAIRLQSRHDLTANQFWPTLGFSHTATSRSPSRLHPLMLEWTLPLF